ncbi:trypsin-like serine protease [Camelimonas abortus]|uniref:S1 family peptidase n=1 Tax=Camelimonas abortus TaxID=1017184 RepID=A0ABV7LG46_9HYPH
MGRSRVHAARWRRAGVPGRARVAAAAALAWLFPSAAPAIVGGEPETGPASASTVMVLGSNGSVCSGVVVSPRAVLTAGHCADGPGERRVHFMEAGAPALLEPAEIRIHPGYVRDAARERRPSVDLALVRLSQSLPGRFVPAALSAGPQPRAGDLVTVSGFGADGRRRADGRLRSATLPVTEPWGPGRILLWLGATRGRPQGACAGDSGGPVWWGDTVTAVTGWSKGARGAPCGETTQGVLLAPQRAWIDATLAEWGERAQWR